MTINIVFMVADGVHVVNMYSTDLPLRKHHFYPVIAQPSLKCSEKKKLKLGFDGLYLIAHDLSYNSNSHTIGNYRPPYRERLLSQEV